MSRKSREIESIGQVGRVPFASGQATNWWPLAVKKAASGSNGEGSPGSASQPSSSCTTQQDAAKEVVEVDKSRQQSLPSGVTTIKPSALLRLELYQDGCENVGMLMDRLLQSEEPQALLSDTKLRISRANAARREIQVSLASAGCAAARSHPLSALSQAMTISVQEVTEVTSLHKRMDIYNSW